MPTELSFIDTNILVYRVSHKDGLKRRIASALLESVRFCLSTQVLQEFFVTAVNPMKLAFSHESACALLEGLMIYPLHMVDRSTIRSATALSQRYRISYWDSVVLASAKAEGCKTIYTEDLNPGQDYSGVRVVNPFTGSCSGPAAS